MMHSLAFLPTFFRKSHEYVRLQILDVNRSGNLAECFLPASDVGDSERGRRRKGLPLNDSATRNSQREGDSMSPFTITRNSKLIRRVCHWDMAILFLLAMCCISLCSKFGQISSGQIVQTPGKALQSAGSDDVALTSSTVDREQLSHAVEPKPTDPCHGRPSPPPIHAHMKPPSLYFLHIPKTAGTMMHNLVIQYANKTKGLACQFLFDGNRLGPEHFSMSIRPPPTFPGGSIEQQAVIAEKSRDHKTKGELYRKGACRAVRGHVTYRQRDAIEAPLISFTVVRDPLERFVSMYEFVLMMIRTRPGATGWDRWLSGAPLHDEFANASSIVNQGFYDATGEWIAKNNIGFSFHFYGVLHQLSGIDPVFEGVGDPSAFRIANAEQMAEKAKNNICGTHILGSQGDMNRTLDTFFNTLEPFASWTESERLNYKKASPINRNHQRKSRDVDEHLPGETRTELEKRLHYEIEVYRFAQDVIEYRAQK